MSSQNEADVWGFEYNPHPKRNELVESTSRSTAVSTSKQETVQFAERSHFNLDEFEYERNGTNPGKVIIFNHEIYDNPHIQIRRGSRRDVNEIIYCFQRLGFNIEEDDILTDLTVQEISGKLDSVLEDKQSLQQANSFILFFLTHGEKDDQLLARDGEIKCSDIWTKFNNCEELKRKPKMFVFQACKGKFYTTTDGKESEYNPQTDPSKLLDMNSFTVNRLGVDMLLVYSTIEGNISLRNRYNGTWFIQELCKNFTSYGRRDDVISLITRTIKCVCGNYYSYNELESLDYRKQMPIFVSTLSRKFYLNRNKERHLLLEMKRRQDEIFDMLKELLNAM